MEALLFVALLGAGLAWVFFHGYRRAKRRRELLNEGIPIQAMLIAKRHFRQKGSRYQLVYEYNPDGRTRTGRSYVSREQFDAHSEGRMLAVRYLASNPDVSAPEFVLDQAREPKR